MAIGQKLEEARNRKGISIREAQECTKIRGDYLSAFEANNFDIKLPEVYLRGFVRLYARFLDLDQESIVSDLSTELGLLNGKSVKKSLGSITNGEGVDNLEGVNPAPSSSTVTPKYFNASLRKPMIYVLAALSTIILIITSLINYFSETKNIKEKSATLNSNIKEVNLKSNSASAEKKNEVLKQTHVLKLVSVGPIEKLFVLDGSDSLQEFKNLNDGWETEITITKSFRCYCTDLENLRFAINGNEKKVDGVGPGNFNWTP